MTAITPKVIRTLLVHLPIVIPPTKAFQRWFGIQIKFEYHAAAWRGGLRLGRWIAFVFLVVAATTGLARAEDGPTAAIFPQIGHAQGVSSVVFSPDGTLLVSGGIDQAIKVWDLASGRLVRTIQSPELVYAVAFSPIDHGTLASCGPRGVQLWHLESSTPYRVLPRAWGECTMNLARDGKHLAFILNSDDGVAVWDISSNRLLRTFASPKDQKDNFWCSALSPNAKTLATGSFGGGISFWDVATGRQLRVLQAASSDLPAEQTTSVSFSPDGAVLATTSEFGSVTLWDVNTGKKLRVLIATPESPDSVNALQFSPDSKLLATGADDKLVYVWDVATGRKLEVLRGHAERVYSVAFSPNGELLATGSDDETVKLWDARTQEVKTLGRNTDPILSFSLAPGAQRLGVAASFHDAGQSEEYSTKDALVDFANGQITSWNTEPGHLQKDIGVAGVAAQFSPSGKVVATVGLENTVALWDASTKRQIGLLTGHGDRVVAIAFSPDGTILASASADKSIKLWDLATLRQVRTLSTAGGVVDALAFSPDGKLLASGDAEYQGPIKLWDVATSKEVHELATHWGTYSLTFSPDGKLLVSGGLGEKGTAADVWDVATFTKLRSLDGHNLGQIFVAVSPDNKELATASLDNTIKLWDLATGHELRTLTGHLGWVTKVQFSADGQELVSSSFDGTIRVWDVATGTERASLIQFSDGSSVAVTPQGFFDSSSEQAEDNLNVRIGNRVFGISSFRDNFYRPDLVGRALAGEDISQFGSIDKVKLSPEVEIANLPSNTSNPNLKMTVDLTNGGGGFGPVRVFWNGTVVQQDTTLPSTGEVLVRSYTVPLQGGNNDLRVTAFNADGTMWSDARATVTSPMPAKSTSAHGTLHAIVIGIPDFPKAPAHNLKYPAADARLVADTLTLRAAPLFDKLDVQLLPPGQSDKAHLVHALTAMQSVAVPGDEFVLYVASHGIVFGNQYYVITSDMIDPLNRSNLSAHAISDRELGDLIGNIHASRKLIILDTCDSGAVGAALNSGPTAQTTATVLGRDFGFTVLAATASNEDALEGGYNGHGLFTYVLNDGLSGKAVDQATGIVTNFLLADYVKKQVPTLAQSVLHRDQEPTTETSGRSFGVTRVSEGESRSSHPLP